MPHAFAARLNHHAEIWFLDHWCVQLHNITLWRTRFWFSPPPHPSVTTVLLGSRAGFWRLHRVLTERDIPVTVYAVGRALEQNPDAGQFLAFIASSFSYFFFPSKNSFLSHPSSSSPSQDMQWRRQVGKLRRMDTGGLITSTYMWLAQALVYLSTFQLSN